MQSSKLPPRRIHITGGPGSGKTTLSRRLATLLEAPIFELDGLGLELQPSFTREDGSTDHAGLIAAREAELEALSRTEAWVSDGSNFAIAQPLLRRADLIVLMEASWRVAGYRIVARHVKAELRRNNRFPGWRRMYQFWHWSRRYYSGRNPHGLNVWGTPETRAFTAQLLHGYEAKLVVCRDKSDVAGLIRLLSAAKIEA